MDTYWAETPKQFYKRIKVYKEMQEEEVKKMDIFNHNLGWYVSYAFNNPENYPKKAFSQQEKVQSQEDFKNYMRNLSKMNKRKNGHNS